VTIVLPKHPKLDCPNTEEDYEALFFVFAVEHGDMDDDVTTLSWYDDIIEYLKTQTFTEDMKPNECRRFRL